mmetsp:Transcript_8523/g.24541  ORF Transcript_8523/g.24541 Transcript_8523/m.24541 type:complete len:318 (+) Transcript_8523:107-1060(+)
MCIIEHMLFCRSVAITSTPITTRIEQTKQRRALLCLAWFWNWCSVQRALDGTAFLLRKAPWEHGDKLFGCGWVNGDRGVKVGLGGSHLHGDAESLEHLIGAHSDHVQSDDHLFFAGADQLHRSLWLVIGLHLPWSVVQVGEFGAVDLDVVLAVLGNGLVLAESDGADWRGRKHDRWDEVVRDLGVLVLFRTEQTIGQTTAGGDGGWGELHLSDDVTKSKHSVDVGFGVIVDFDVPALLLLHSKPLQVQRLDERLASRCHQNDVGVFDGFTVLQVHGLQPILFGDLCNSIRVAEDFDSLPLHFGIQRRLQNFVKASER